VKWGERLPRQILPVLLLLPLLALTACSKEEDASAALAALEAEYDAGREGISESRDSLVFPTAEADSAERAEFRELLDARNQEYDDLRDAFLPRYAELAEEYWGTRAALEAKLWAMSREPRPDPDEVEDVEEAREARAEKIAEHAEAILEEYAESPHMELLAESSYMLSDEQAEEFLGQLRENSPHPNVRAAAIYYPASRKLSRLRMEERYGDLDPGEESDTEEASDPEEDADPRAEVNADLQLLIDEYGEVAMGGSTYGAVAYAHLTAHSAEELAIGQPAPEIVGTNVDGEEMRLSDFLGKVVVIDFWGDW
jgi:hypothetical protein